MRLRGFTPSTASVRTRIVVSTLALTAIALIVSGLVAARIQDAVIVAGIDEDLASDASEFIVLAEGGADPRISESFDAPSDALRSSMSGAIPEPYEGRVGFVDGSLAYVVEDAGIRLEQDDALLAAIAPLTTAVGQILTRIETPVTTYRVAVTVIGEDGSGGIATDAGDAADGVELAAEVVAYDESAMLGRFDYAFRIYGWVAFLSFVLVAAVAWILAGRALAPVRTLAHTAREIGRDDLSERIPVTGNDDLAEMTESVNSMLDRIEAAFDSHTRLLDDVSHELRTPLTIVRGHLELMDPHDADDAGQAREVSLDELDRMARLVEDLMTLAKSDRPGFLDPSDIDLQDLTAAVLAKARALGDREWRAEGQPAGAFVGDSQRLTQAWLQLAANAARYTDTGTHIGIGSAMDAFTVRLWVSDEGPGIDPDTVPHLFDRYSQGGHSEGIGLGLAIVDTIAAAHGGTVEVDTELGVGSTFTLVLPLAGPPRWEDLP